MIQLTKDNIHLIQEGTVAYVSHHFNDKPHRYEVIKFLDSKLEDYTDPWRSYISLTNHNRSREKSSINTGPFIRRPEIFKMYILEECEVDQAIILIRLGVTDRESIELASNQLKLGVNKS